MIDVKKMRELAKETRYMADVASEIGHAGAAEQFIECAGAILALCDRLEAMEHEHEDQNRYLAAQSEEIAGLKQRLAQQPSVEVMEKRILKLADKYRIDYGGDYSRNAKEHEIDLLAFVRAVLSDPTQQPSGEVTDFGEQALSILEELVRMRYEKCRIVCQDHISAVTFQTARALIDAARTQGGES